MTTQPLTKTIRYDRETRDFAMYLDGAYVGSRATHDQAETALDQLASDELAHAASPIAAAVEGALERLATESGDAARCARADGDNAASTHFRRAATSYTNALIAYRRGVRPDLLDSGAYLLPSRRPGEPAHLVRMDGDWICTCAAGAAMHWPIALVVGMEVAFDDLARYGDDGDAADSADMACDPPDAPNPLGDDAGDAPPDSYQIGAYVRAHLLATMLARSAQAIQALTRQAA